MPVRLTAALPTSRSLPACSAWRTARLRSLPIDIGTNSIHLVIARPTGNNRFEVIDREKEVVRLGSGSGDMKRLDPRRDRTRHRHARPVPAARRQPRRGAARGGHERGAGGGEPRRVRPPRPRRGGRAGRRSSPGAEEARLIRLGVLQAVPGVRPAPPPRRHRRRQHRVLVGRGQRGARGAEPQARRDPAHRAVRARRIRCGARRWRSAGSSSARTSTQVERAWCDALGFDIAIGSSGTIVNVAEMVRGGAGDAPMLQVSGAVIDDDGLRRRRRPALLEAGIGRASDSRSRTRRQARRHRARRRARPRAGIRGARHRRDGRLRLRAARGRAARRAPPARPRRRSATCAISGTRA